MTIPVHFIRCSSYKEGLAGALSQALAPLLPHLSAHSKLLVKPNLIAAQNSEISCTNTRFVLEVCRFLKDAGHSVTVADSPAFGSAHNVAGHNGLLEGCRKYQIPLRTLDQGVRVPLANGKKLRLARRALDCDCIINLPKLKVHTQMRFSLGVKNLFGCVCGISKALIHYREGDRGNRFPSTLVDVMLSLPPALTLVDGIVAMHRTGPIHGQPFKMGLIGASSTPVSLDTAVYDWLKVSPGFVPLWEECIRRELPGSLPGDIHYNPAPLADISLDGFEIPGKLTPQSFRPVRLVQSLARRIYRRLPGR